MFFHGTAIAYIVSVELIYMFLKGINQKIKTMKKLMLSVALMAGVCGFANANTTEEVYNVEITETTVTCAQQDGFVAVKLEDLNENVQKAIKTYSETNTVKELAYSADKKQTKVTLVSNSDKSEKVVVLNDDGQEV